MGITLSAILIMVFVIIYFLIINFFSVLFRITGLSIEKSKFQAISLLTNSGFTTKESEIITNNKTRRRLATLAMITGYGFSVIIVSLLINLIFSLSGEVAKGSFPIILISFVIFLVLILVLRIPIVAKGFSKLLEEIAHTILKKHNNDNTITLLDDYGEDCICEVYLKQVPSPLKETPLMKSGIKKHYGLNVLIIQRENKKLEITKDTMLEVNDTLVVFGSFQNVKDCFSLKKNDVDVIVLSDEDKDANVIRIINNFGPQAVVDVTVNQVPSVLKETKLYQSGVKENYNINFLALRRDEEHIPIDKDTIIIEGDLVTVIGEYNKIRSLFIK